MHEIPWTFKTWVSKFIAVDLPIGDLARDIASDPNFPDDDDLPEIFDYLLKKKADYVILNTFTSVWNFYQVTR